MSDDEDWFERAFKESTEKSSGDEADDRADAESDEPTLPEEDDPFAASGPEPDEGPADATEASTGPDEEPTGTSDESAGATEAAGAGGTATEEESPFDMDFSTAFQNAPDMDVGQQPGGGAGAEPGSGHAPDFDDPESFDEEEFESDIERLKIGIEGLDDMILGGVPKRSLMVAIGSAGTGKTTFGMEFVRTALENGDNAVYISLEESRERILNTADEKGWEFSHYEQEDQLAIVSFDPVEMANTLSSIQSELPSLIEEFDADRLVLDSVSLLEMMYDHPSKRRSEVYGFTKALKQGGVTTFVTSEASQDNPYTSRHGLIEYLADAVFVLQYVRPSDFQETRMAIEIQKIRDANHSRETKPYEISGDGIEVYRQANIF